MKNKFLFLFILLLSLAVINFVILLPLNIRYTNVLFLLLIVIAIIFIVLGTNFKINPTVVNNKIDLGISGSNKLVIKIFATIIILNIILPFISSPLFFASSYANLIGEIETKEFSSDFNNPELDALPIVDSEYAKVLGNKKLGSTSGLGSEFHVGTYTDIIYQGEFYAVAPLEYNDIFKWLNNRNKGTPGYILINKSTAKVDFVTEVNGEEIGLKYVDSAYLFQDLKRNAYFGGGWNNQLLDPFFELDEEGNPYFIYPKTKKTIGWNGGDDVYQVVVVDAMSGETTVYDVGDQPDWIDNVYPKTLVDEHLNYHGKYINGFFNSLFSQEGLLMTTAGQRHIVNDDALYTYTGMTSVGADESTVGMAFVDVSTKGTSLYSLTGATEDAAMKSAEGKVQNLEYTATFPIPVSINGEGAYFIALKDRSGLIKQYAFVNINNYSIVENDTEIESAYLKYVETMGYNNIEDVDILEEMEATVVRINAEIKDGNTRYVLLVEVEDTNYLYLADQISDELALTTEGDNIVIKVNEDNILEFDNLDIDYDSE